VPEHAEREVEAAAPAPAAPIRAHAPTGVLALQRSAGNRAVVAMLARDTWSKDYRSRKSRQGLSYEDYKKAIGTEGAEKYAPEIKAASQWGGTPLSPVALTRAELGAIVLYEGTDAAGRAAHEKRLDDYLPFINNSFEAMSIDTVEAQSSFLAHAAESGSFAQMTEQGAEKRPYAPFIGRGPIQVTWEAGYIQALAYVERRGEQLEAEAVDLETKTPGSPEAVRKRELAALAKEATTAIKGDIKEAANPKYAFLFSLGAMELTRGVKRSANLKGISSPSFAGNRDEDQWVTNFTESFQDTLDKAPARKAEAEARLKAAETELAAAPAEDAAGRTAIEKRIKAAQGAIRMQEGAMRDMPSALRGAKVKKGIYERAYKTLSAKAKAAAAP
jgi:hypothetical protein